MEELRRKWEREKANLTKALQRSERGALSLKEQLAALQRTTLSRFRAKVQASKPAADIEVTMKGHGCESGTCSCSWSDVFKKGLAKAEAMKMSGSGGDTANGSADGGGGKGTTDTSRSGLPKRSKARIKWMRREHAKDHVGATVMNGRLRRGEYGRKGCYVTAEDLNCQFCAMAKMRARSRSNVHSRVRPGMVLSHWSWDIYEPPKEFQKNQRQIY